MSVIEAAEEWNSIDTTEWNKIVFHSETGGFIATHRLKDIDDICRFGIAAEVNACDSLAISGKRIFRLPENVLDKIDDIIIDGRKYRNLLKFNNGENKPRGYPDAYFDGQTWDFKAPLYNKVESIRKLIKDGRKADNIIFIIVNEQNIEMIKSALNRELGNQTKWGSWNDLPDIYYLSNGQLFSVWKK